MNIDFEKLRAFTQIVQEGGIRKAAKKLHIDKSSVSRHLQTLETEFGCELLTRSHDGITLTADGQYVYDTARQILDQVKVLKDRFEEIQGGPLKGSLRINSTHALAATWLTLILGKFIHLHPHLLFEIFATNEVPDLAAGGFDVAIRPWIHGASHLVQEPLMRWKLQLYASAEYIEKYGMPKRPEELDRHRLIMFGDPAMDLPPSYVAWPLHIGTKSGIPRKPSIVLNSVPGMYNLVQAGLGIGCFTQESPIFQRYSLVPVLPDLLGTEVEVCYIYPEKFKTLSKIQTFLRYLKNESAKSL